MGDSNEPTLCQLGSRLLFDDSHRWRPGGGRPAGAADAGGPARGHNPRATLETIVVTGSYIRRTDTESPSPVDVITADDILKRGMTNIADVIHSLSSDNSGTLTQNFSGAMAGGASGVSLRGLTVDATLVLVDGHRMATYPLATMASGPSSTIGSLPLESSIGWKC